MRTEVGHGGRTRGWGIGPGYGEIREIHKKDKIYSKFEKDQKYEKYENYEMSRVIRGSRIRGEPDGGPALPVFLLLLHRGSGVALHELGLEHDFLLRHIWGVGLAQQQLNRFLGHLRNRLQYCRKARDDDSG